MAMISLPDELIEKIIQHTDQDDLPSIVLTCRRVCRIAYPRYKEHIDLQKRYWTLRIPPGCATATLLDFLRSPRLARYPRNLDGTKMLESPNIVHFQTNENDAELAHFAKLQEVDRLLRRSKIPKRLASCQMQYFLDRIALDEEEVAVSMLMALLPNLTNIDLPLFASQSYAFRNFLEFTLNPPAFVDCSSSDVPLSRLSSVSFVPTIQEAIVQGVLVRAFPIWNSFLDVPSLRRFSLSDAGFVNYGVFRYLDYSNIEHLILRDCMIHSKSFLPFLNMMKCLKIFDCALEKLELYRGRHLYSICNALVEWRSSTLQSFRMDMIYHPTSISSIDFLKHFEALQYIEVGWPWIVPHQLVGLFKNVLPTAIETVKIVPARTETHLLCQGGRNFLAGADEIDDRGFSSLKNLLFPLWSWNKETGMTVASWAEKVRCGSLSSCVCGRCNWRELDGNSSLKRRQIRVLLPKRGL